MNTVVGIQCNSPTLAPRTINSCSKRSRFLDIAPEAGKLWCRSPGTGQGFIDRKNQETRPEAVARSESASSGLRASTMSRVLAPSYQASGSSLPAAVYALDPAAVMNEKETE